MGARIETSELYELEVNLEDSLETNLEEPSNSETKVVLENVSFLGFLRLSQNLSLNATVKMTEQSFCRESIKNL